MAPALRQIRARIWTEFTDGRSFDEIAAGIDGWDAQSLRRLARHGDMPIGLGRGKRCLLLMLEPRTLSNLAALSDRSGRSRKEVASAILRFALEGDGRKAVRLLGKMANTRKQRIPKHDE